MKATDGIALTIAQDHSVDTRTAARYACLHLLGEGKAGGSVDVLAITQRGSNTTIQDEIVKTRQDVARFYLQCEAFETLMPQVAGLLGEAARKIAESAAAEAEAQLAAAHDQANAEITTALANVATTQAERDDAHQRLAQQRLRIEALQQELVTSHAQIDEFRVEVSRLRTELQLERVQAAEERIRHRSELKNEVDSLTERLLIKEELAEEFRAERERAEGKNSVLETNLQQVNQSLLNTQATLERQFATTNRSEKALERERIENKTLKRQLEVMASIESQLVTLRDQNIALSQALELNHVRLEHANSVNAEQCARLATSEELRRQAENEAAELRGRLEGQHDNRV